MGLRDIGATLPPGFRFYPSDDELICHYLHKKITNEESLNSTLIEIDLHTCEPWQLPDVAKLNANEWYFFSLRDRKYARGFRTNRATTSGYWKSTGKDRTVRDPATGEAVGMKKTLVFYGNRTPNGIKTGWIMHEFRLETPHMTLKADWVLCRVFHKSKELENTTSPKSHFALEATASNNVPLNLVSSPLTNQGLPCSGYNQPFTSSSSTPAHQNHDNSAFLNLLQLSQERNNDPIFNGTSTKGDDDFGYLWENMNLEETSLGGGTTSDFEDMRFDIDNNICLPMV